MPAPGHRECVLACFSDWDVRRVWCIRTLREDLFWWAVERGSLPLRLLGPQAAGGWLFDSFVSNLVVDYTTSRDMDVSRETRASGCC